MLTETKTTCKVHPDNKKGRCTKATQLQKLCVQTKSLQAWESEDMNLTQKCSN